MIIITFGKNQDRVNNSGHAQKIRTNQDKKKFRKIRTPVRPAVIKLRRDTGISKKNASI